MVTLSEDNKFVIVIEYTDGHIYYVTESMNSSEDIYDAKLFETREKAREIVDEMVAAGPPSYIKRIGVGRYRK